MRMTRITDIVWMDMMIGDEPMVSDSLDCFHSNNTIVSFYPQGQGSCCFTLVSVVAIFLLFVPY